MSWSTTLRSHAAEPFVARLRATLERWAGPQRRGARHGRVQRRRRLDRAARRARAPRRCAPPLRAVHVDHGLHAAVGELAARTARAVAAELGVAFLGVRVAVPRDCRSRARSRCARSALSRARRLLAPGEVLLHGASRRRSARDAAAPAHARHGRARSARRARASCRSARGSLRAAAARLHAGGDSHALALAWSLRWLEDPAERRSAPRPELPAPRRAAGAGRALAGGARSAPSASRSR